MLDEIDVLVEIYIVFVPLWSISVGFEWLPNPGKASRCSQEAGHQG